MLLWILFALMALGVAKHCPVRVRLEHNPTYYSEGKYNPATEECDMTIAGCVYERDGTKEHEYYPMHTTWEDIDKQGLGYVYNCSEGTWAGVHSIRLTRIQCIVNGTKYKQGERVTYDGRRQVCEFGRDKNNNYWISLNEYVCPQKEVYQTNFYRNGVYNINTDQCDMKPAGCLIRSKAVPFGKHTDTGKHMGFRVECYTEKGNMGTRVIGCLINGSYAMNGRRVGVGSEVYECQQTPAHKIVNLGSADKLRKECINRKPLIRGNLYYLHAFNPSFKECTPLVEGCVVDGKMIRTDEHIDTDRKMGIRTSCVFDNANPRVEYGCVMDSKYVADGQTGTVNGVSYRCETKKT